MTKSNKTENFVLLGKIENWKNKAKKRRLENDYLRQRVKELTNSRDNWKEKYKAEKAKILDLLKQIKATDKLAVEEDKIKHHSYGVKVVMLMVWLRSSSSVSLRACRQMLSIFNIVYGLNFKIPSIGSIQNWEKKLGYHRLQKFNKPVNTINIGVDEWCIILDESISIGEEKVLLILGIRLCDDIFGKALSLKEVNVLGIQISKSWTAVKISKAINDLLSMNYDIKYVVSDGCSTLKSATKASGLTRISDCTHAFGNILKKRYKEDENYLNFNKQCGILRRQVALGENAVIAPPKYRKKAKFLNLWERSKWAFNMLQLLELSDESSEKNGHKSDKILSDSMLERLSFLKNYKILIEELYLQCSVINKLHKVLKKSGLSKETIIKCKKILTESYSMNKEEEQDFFEKGIEQYFKEQELLIDKLEIETIICTSDIIESMFGKYKERAKRSGGFITDDCLSMANFSQNFSESEVKKSLEEVKIIDIIEWRKQNCKDSLRAKKQKLSKNIKSFYSKSG